MRGARVGENGPYLGALGQQELVLEVSLADLGQKLISLGVTPAGGEEGRLLLVVQREVDADGVPGRAEDGGLLPFHLAQGSGLLGLYVLILVRGHAVRVRVRKASEGARDAAVAVLVNCK